MSDQCHSIIGLPGSGKTTFLAAIWHLCDAGEVETSLVLNKLEGDVTYLNSIVESWRRCQRVPRTSLGDEARFDINLLHTPTERQISLRFPDLSGESFDKQFCDRRCDAEYVEEYEPAGGILLFLNADGHTDGVEIAALGELYAAEDEESGEPVSWSAEMAPQQVKLVELLQFTLGPPFRRCKRKLAVVVSAWDVVKEDGRIPSHWLEREYPLLYQFLIANKDQFDFRVYGISAQGGPIESDVANPTSNPDPVRESLLQKIPSQRVECIFEECVSHDLTIPICWVSELDS